MSDGALREFLRPTTYVDSDADTVVAFARRVTDGVADPVARAVALYHAVRDEITYTAYCDFKSVETYRASGCLARGAGFCVGKAALLAATARAADIPARVGFADVRNHLTSPRLRRLMTTDVFYYHGYAELYLDGAWVKATAVFDKTLCERVGIRPLEFDGRSTPCSTPSTRAAAGTWNTCATAARAPTCPSRRSSRRSSATIPASSRWAPPVPSIASATRPSACRRLRDPRPNHCRARRALGRDSPAARELIRG